MTKFAGKYRSAGFTPKNVAYTPAPTYTPRETTRYPSRVTAGGEASAPPTRQYTGTNIVGIGTMHKSNSVPVFSQDQAIEIATMRRG